MRAARVAVPRTARVKGEGANRLATEHNNIEPFTNDDKGPDVRRAAVRHRDGAKKDALAD